MPTQEIPRDEWTTFFDRFSRQHEGWLATLEVLSTDIGAQEEARDLPLEGISATSKDSAPEIIAISLGKTPENHVTHTISDPTRLWLQQTAQGANAALEIESADQVKTLLRFRSALPAEMVDGVVLENRKLENNKP
jgi:Family of unknown function (DUF5335)